MLNHSSVPEQVAKAPVLFYPSGNAVICLTNSAPAAIGPSDGGANWVPLSRF